MMICNTAQAPERQTALQGAEDRIGGGVIHEDDPRAAGGERELAERAAARRDERDRRDAERAAGVEQTLEMMRRTEAERLTRRDRLLDLLETELGVQIHGQRRLAIGHALDEIVMLALRG